MLEDFLDGLMLNNSYSTEIINTTEFIKDNTRIIYETIRVCYYWDSTIDYLVVREGVSKVPTAIFNITKGGLVV